MFYYKLVYQRSLRSAVYILKRIGHRHFQKLQGEEEQSDGHRFDEKRQEVERAQKIMEIRHEFSEAENEGHFESGQTQRCQKIAEQNNSHSEPGLCVRKGSLNYIL